MTSFHIQYSKEDLKMCKQGLKANGTVARNSQQWVVQTFSSCKMNGRNLMRWHVVVIHLLTIGIWRDAKMSTLLIELIGGKVSRFRRVCKKFQTGSIPTI